MTDTNDEWSEVCPWTYLKQMVEGGALEPEILKKLTDENEKLKETIRKQGDRLAIYTAKEEKPHTPSSAVAHAVLELKNDEIQFLKEEIEKLKLEIDQLTCWRTSLQKKVDELEPELADYKRISGKQEKRLQEVFAENEKLCEKDDY